MYVFILSRKLYLNKVFIVLLINTNYLYYFYNVNSLFYLDFFLIYADNFLVSIVIFIFLLTILDYTFSFYYYFNSVLFFNSVCFNFIFNNFYFFKFFYFDYLCILIPIISILLVSGNIMVLSQNQEFNFFNLNYVVLLISYQWSWDFYLFFFNYFYFTFSYSKFYLYFKIFNVNYFYKVKCLIFDSNFIIIPNRCNILFSGFSLDVNHCLFIPNLSIKEDIINEKCFNILIKLFIDLKVENLIYFICFEYCGLNHYIMDGVFLPISSEYFLFL